MFRRHDQGAPERLETGYEDIGARRPRRPPMRRRWRWPSPAAREVGARRRSPCGSATSASSPRCSPRSACPSRWRRRLRRSFGAADADGRPISTRLSAPRDGEDARLDPELRAAADAHDRERPASALLEARLDAHGHAEGAGPLAATRSPSASSTSARSPKRTSSATRARDAARLSWRFAASLPARPRRAARLRAAARPRPRRGARRLRRARRGDQRARASPAAIRFEAGFGRPLDYYTGLVFEIARRRRCRAARRRRALRPADGDARRASARCRRSASPCGSTSLGAEGGR